MLTTLHSVSLFSGIGLLDLGLHRAGIETRIFCESDRAARGVLTRRFPGIPIQTDVRELTADDLTTAGADPSRTVLAGGFPCQDISVAGGRAGMGEGTRSGLFWHIPRLLADFPARWVVLENVPGLLSSRRGWDMGAVVGALGELGYGLSWRVLDAQHFGVPQRRRRVVIVGHLGAPWGAPAEILLEPESGGGDLATLTGQGPRPAGDAAGSTPAHRITSALTAHHGRMTAEDADNLVTFQKVIRSGYRDSDGSLPPDKWEHRDVAATLSPNDLTGPSRAVELVVSATGPRTHALTSQGHDAGEDGTGRGTPIVAFQPQAAPCLQWTQRASIAGDGTVRRLTPLECERLQGAPDGWTDGQSDSARYRQLGNAVAVPVFEWVARRLVAIDARITSEVAGLLDLGLHRAGIPTRLLCEADKAARSVLARRFPDVPIHPDVQELT